MLSLLPPRVPIIPLLATVLCSFTTPALATAAATAHVQPRAPQDSTTTDANVNLDTVPAQNNVKILVCGDSITQGADGDFTWRYRLWEWFREASNTASVPQDLTGTTPIAAAQTYITPTLQFVGPYNGTLPASVADDIDLSDPQTWGTYNAQVDPAFYPGGGSQHFAVYGRPAWMDIDLIQAQVATYTPDFVILHLGFNDFSWWTQTATELIESVRQLVWNARLGKSDVKILIADVSNRLLLKGREDIPPTTESYNLLLKQNALGWSTVESPVIVVKVSEDYDCHVESCPAGKDGLHPNALGDFQIARAYTKVLHEKYNFGAAPLVVPNIESIPGFQVVGVNGATTTSRFMYPPVGIFFVVSALCLVAVLMLRPKLLKVLRPGAGESGKYQLLPTVREAS